MKKYFFFFSAFFFFKSINIYAQNNAILPTKLATTTLLKTPAGTTAQANGVNCSTMIVTVDTSIRVSPKHAYLSVDITGFTGTSQMEILGGTHSFWVFDKAGKQIIFKEKVLYNVKAEMGNNVVKLILKIPFRLKTDKNLYTVHYRWENKDKRKNMDLLTVK